MAKQSQNIQQAELNDGVNSLNEMSIEEMKARLAAYDQQAAKKREASLRGAETRAKKREEQGIAPREPRAPKAPTVVTLDQVVAKQESRPHFWAAIEFAKFAQARVVASANTAEPIEIKQAIEDVVTFYEDLANELIESQQSGEKLEHVAGRIAASKYPEKAAIMGTVYGLPGKRNKSAEPAPTAEDVEDIEDEEPAEETETVDEEAEPVEA